MAMRAVVVALVLIGALSDAAGAAPPAAASSPQSIVFITSPKRSGVEASLADLRRIFLGQVSRWRDGRRMILFVRPSNTPEGRAFLARVVQMPDIDYSQWWIGAVFRGQAAAAPRVVETPEKMIRAVAANPDAIGFVSPGDVTRDVSVVTVRE